MKKILFGLSVFFTTLISAQNYPDYYPTNSNNNGYYGDYDDEYYFPDDYYYEYPSDYYRNDLYQSYYNDYQRSIYDVNWNRFISVYRLAPWQVQQIMMLNDRFPSYAAWNSYYRYNPDRWYYDRFYALERILGPRVFVIFQNNYYNGYSPVVYWQNYRRQHYVTNVYIVPKYRNINVNRYKINRTQYHQNNPRQNFGFTDTPRTGNGNWNNSTRENGFRKDGSLQNSNGNSGFRNGTDAPSANTNTAPRTQNGGTRSGVKTETSAPNSSGGFRDSGSGFRNTEPQKRTENNSGGFRNQSPATTAPSSSTRSSGQRFTTR
ncbi:hypothetical protein CBW16_08005 [Flavobacteriaceae bacterium JJC]|nr:hypothetical protein CBW16_08005 [Flavobacteriaceae bacterium JJC]